MQIEIAAIYSFCQLGQRVNQEDARYPDSDIQQTDQTIFVVCDGVGGSDKGEVASATVCSAIAQATKGHNATKTFSDRDFQRVLTLAYQELDRVAERTSGDMGTTLTFLAIHSGGVLAAHIGDSRIYQIRTSEGILYRSDDHSLVNELLRSGNISPDQVRNHPKGNIITRCMNAGDGSREHDEATVVNLTDIATGDYFMLCTDGVVNSIEDEELIAILAQDRSDKAKIDEIAKLSNRSSDNNTSILIRIGMVNNDATQDDENNDTTAHVKTRILGRNVDGVHNVGPEQHESKLKRFLSWLFK